MFSGKTTQLIDLYNKYININIFPMIINPTIIDNCKYLISHDNIKIKCTSFDKLCDIFTCSTEYSLYNKSRIILINEGQFFNDLEQTVIRMLYDGKIIYISGLDCDYKREKFDNISNLIHMSDITTKYNAICNTCTSNMPAIFSHRLISNEERILIGDETKYTPVCRKCYINLTL
jgi:thymidine kinase